MEKRWTSYILNMSNSNPKEDGCTRSDRRRVSKTQCGGTLCKNVMLSLPIQSQNYFTFRTSKTLTSLISLPWRTFSNILQFTKPKASEKAWNLLVITTLTKQELGFVIVQVPIKYSEVICVYCVCYGAAPSAYCPTRVWPIKRRDGVPWILIPELVILSTYCREGGIQPKICKPPSGTLLATRQILKVGGHSSRFHNILSSQPIIKTIALNSDCREGRKKGRLQ